MQKKWAPGVKRVIPENSKYCNLSHTIGLMQNVVQNVEKQVENWFSNSARIFAPEKCKEANHTLIER